MNNDPAAAHGPSDGDRKAPSRPEEQSASHGTHDHQPRQLLALRDHRVWLWLGGDCLSSIGDQVTSFTLTFASVPLLGPGAAGLSLAALGLPRLVVPLWAGALADRTPPRRLLAVCHLIRVVLLAVLAVVWHSHPGLPGLLATVIVLGLGASLADPANRALLPRTVRPVDLTRAIAVRSAANNTAIILGAPLAGLLLSVANPATVLALDGATFALAALSLTRLPSAPHRPADQRRTASEIITGMRYAASNQLIGPALALFAALNLSLCGPVELGVTQLAHSQHWPHWHLGLLLSSFGIGATASALALATLTSRIRRPGTWALSTCATAATGLLLSATNTRMGPLFLAISLLGATAAAGTLLAAVIQLNTPPDLTGRISGLLTTTIWGTWALSFAATGQLLHDLTPRTTLLIASAMLALSTLLCAKASPELRRYRTSAHT